MWFTLLWVLITQNHFFPIDRDRIHFTLFEKPPAGDAACPDRSQSSRDLKHCNDLIKNTKISTIKTGYEKQRGGNCSGEIGNKSGQCQRGISPGTGYSEILVSPFGSSCLKILAHLREITRLSQLWGFCLGANSLEL